MTSGSSQILIHLRRRFVNELGMKHGLRRKMKAPCLITRAVHPWFRKGCEKGEKFASHSDLGISEETVNSPLALWLGIAINSRTTFSRPRSTMPETTKSERRRKVWILARPLSVTQIITPLGMASKGKFYLCHWDVLVSDLSVMDVAAI